MARDTVKGQRTVRMDDGREFAIVKGRRWTRIPEYLSNGQLTARWFIDEATGEVRMAAGWKQPGAMIGGEAAEFVRAILALPELTPGEFDGYLTPAPDGGLRVEVAGAVVGTVPLVAGETPELAAQTQMENARTLLAQHAADRPCWFVGNDGRSTLI
jgi:hypothetical protein